LGAPQQRSPLAPAGNTLQNIPFLQSQNAELLSKMSELEGEVERARQVRHVNGLPQPPPPPPSPAQPLLPLPLPLLPRLRSLSPSIA